jgi:ATP-dependent metalloprotease
LANALVEYETLDLEEVKKVIKGEPIRTVEEKLLEVIQEPDTPESKPEPSSIPEPNAQPIASVS